MKLLLDQNISHRIVRKVREHFSEVESVKQNFLVNKLDEEIWQFARRGGFAVVTFDEDFYNLNVLYGPPPLLIWLRTGNLSNDEVVRLLIYHKNTITAFLSGELTAPKGCLEIDTWPI